MRHQRPGDLGGVLLVSCEVTPNHLHRLDKNTGVSLGVHGTLTATGLPNLGSGDPGLGSLACDPVTFHKDATGKDLFTDALWSRRGVSGNGVVALEFPAFTCGMPSSSVVLQGAVPFSPLAAGLGAPASGQPGAVPRAAALFRRQRTASSTRTVTDSRTAGRANAERHRLRR